MRKIKIHIRDEDLPRKRSPLWRALMSSKPKAFKDKKKEGLRRSCRRKPSED